MRPFAHALAALALLPAVASASGTLDPGFDGDGMAVVDASQTAFGSESLAAGLIDRQGRYVGVGSGEGFNSTTGTVLRLLANGQRDAGFGDNGVVRVPDVPGFGSVVWQDVEQLVDQRLLVYGRAQNGPNGNDPGRLYVCRLLDNGLLDASFGGGDGCFMPLIVPESTRDSPAGLALQADGKIVLAGITDQGNNGLPYEWFVARYDADGNLDPCFGAGNCVGGGVLIEPEPDSELKNFLPYDVVVDGAGRILLAGAASGPVSQDFGVVRLLPGGAVDAAGFGNQGHQLVAFDEGGVDADSARAIAVRGDGAVFLAGIVDVDVGTFAGVAALDAFGQHMPGFGVAGRTTLFFNDVAFDHLPQRLLLQSDGKLVVSGYTDVFGDAQTLLRDCGVARLRTNGTLDPVFGGDGRLTIDVGVGGESVERCAGAHLDGRRIALFGVHQPESPGETDALVVVLEQDDLFGDGFEAQP